AGWFRALSDQKRRVERIGIDGVVVDEEDALSLLAQSLHHSTKRGLLLLIGSNPPKPHAQRDEISTHCRFGLRSDPPCCSVVPSMALCVRGRQRGLPNPT